MISDVIRYSKAVFPAVAIATSDEDRAIASVVVGLTRDTCRIAATGGLVDLVNNRVIDPNGTFAKGLAWVTDRNNRLLIMLDFQHVVKGAGGYRPLRDAMVKAKGIGSMIVLIAPSWTMIPPELEHDIPVLQDELPSLEDLEGALSICMGSAAVSSIPDGDRRALLTAARGLTLGEAENAFAASVDVQRGTFDPELVLKEKMKAIRQSGFLNLSPPAAVDDLGGLSGLRTYLDNEVVPSLGDCELGVRGILLVGVPGTGKSLAARVLGAKLGRPVLRCDISSLKGSLVGQSEQQIRAALKLAEAVAPCVLYIDEIEKSIGGHASSAQSDGGTVLGMVGILLTWLQEHRSDVLTIATANDYSKLPAELTRAGRFDERFFVDLPNSQERDDIARVHLRRFGPSNVEYAGLVSRLSDGWTGAEIEQLVISAARRSRRNITADVLSAAAADIRPLSAVRKDEITRLREWGRTELRQANSPTPSANPGGRAAIR